MKRSRLGIKIRDNSTHAEAAPQRRFFSLFKSSTFKRVTLFSLAFAIVFSTAYAPSVNASTASDSKQALRAGWVAACVGPIFRGSDRTNISIENIQGYNSVLIGEPIVGHIINQSDGKTSCNAESSKALKENIANLGFGDILGLMRTLGCTQNNSSTSYSCPELSDQQIYTRIAQNKNIPALTNANKYYIAFDTFTIGCKATPTGAVQGSADWAAAEAGTNNLFLLRTISGGSTKLAVYKAELGKDRNISTANPSLGWDDGSFNCNTLANMTRTYANDYIAVNPASNGEELGGQTSSDGSDEESAGSSCSIEAIGWILCPVANSLSSIADGAFSIISDSFLRTDTSVVAPGGPANQAWGIVRNIANIAFVIAFLIIIFSQLTGVGISNYGVKKMLPRLIVSAILVNASFIICQIAIDLSNILGYSINDVFRSISTNVLDLGTENTGVFSQGNLVSDITVGVLAFGAGALAIYALLSALLPVVLAAVVALVMILFILVARQALIVILIVIAPLAFVAFLLPNTEKYFKQWRKMFTALLLVFPIIALVFGGSQLASGIVKVSFSPTLVQTTAADATEEEKASNTETANNWFAQIVSVAILVLPLFLVPSLLKKSLDGIPMAGQLASKWGNRASSKFGGKMKESYRGSIIGRGAAIRKQGRENYRSRRFAERIGQDGKLGKINQGLASGIPITKAEKAANAQLMKSATAAQDRALSEEVNEAKVVIASQDAGFTSKDIQTLATKGSVTVKGRDYKGDTMQRAAIETQLGGVGAYDQIIEIVSATAAGGSLSQYSKMISRAASASSGKDPTLSGKRLGQIGDGQFDYNSATLSAIEEGKFNAEALAGMHDGARAHAIEVAKNAMDKGDSRYMQILAASATTLETSSELRAKVSSDAAKQQLGELKSFYVANAQTPTQASNQPTIEVQSQTNPLVNEPASTTPPAPATTATPVTSASASAPAPATPASATPIITPPTVTRVSTRQQPDNSTLNISHDNPPTPPTPPTTPPTAPPTQPPTQPPTAP